MAEEKKVADDAAAAEDKKSAGQKSQASQKSTNVRTKAAEFRKNATTGVTLGTNRFSRRTITFLSLAIFLFVLSIVGSGYTYYLIKAHIVPNIASNQSVILQSSEQIKTLLSKDEELAQQMSASQAEFNASMAYQTETVQQLTERLAGFEVSVQGELNNVAQLLESADSRANQLASDWHLEESFYVLSMANQRLRVIGDVDTAVRLRRVALRQLEFSANPGLTLIRATIEQEISQLEAVTPIDFAGISSEILTLAEKLPVLPLKKVSLEDEVAPQDSAADGESTDQSWLHSATTEIVEDIKSLVRVNRVDGDGLLVVDPDRKAEITENMRNSLLSAQLALLQNRFKVYRDNLKFVQIIIDQYFDLESADVAQFSRNLQALQNEDFQAELPDVSDSQEQLQMILSAIQDS